jgi:hypothetical protein
MSIIKDNYIFIHIPKTAGTSIEHLIGGSGHKSISRIMQDGYDDFKNRPSNKNLPVVCFVRNPYDRLVSAYHFVKQVNYAQLPPTFPELVNNLDYWMSSTVEHFMPQWKFIESNGKVLCEYIYRFENLQSEFAKMKSEFGIVGDLPHTQKSDHKSYKEYYTPHLIEKVFSAYSKDFSLFGYSKTLIQ